MNKILQYLKTNGEMLDKDIAAATGTTLASARLQLSELSSLGEVMSCYSIKFIDGKKIEGIELQTVRSNSRRLRQVASHLKLLCGINDG